MSTKSKVLSLALLAFTFTAFGCDPTNDRSGEGDAPLSDYDALFEGVPSNDELPFEIKADGPAPRQHSELLEFQSPVKSQGRRGVCSIFSTVGLMEHLYLKAGMEDPDFSEQYLQWSAKFEVNSFPSTSGSNAYYNLQAINRFGIPDEDAWRYEVDQWNETNDPECGEENEDKPTRCYTNGAPPEDALAAEKFHLPASRYVNTSRNSIIDHIRVNETGVVVGLDFFYQSWNHRLSTLPRNLDNWDQGIVLAPNAEDIEESHTQRAGHSIVLVGWDLDKEFPRRDAEGAIIVDGDGNPVMETGFYIFKNSWGTAGFGIENENGPGYGWLSMEYIERYGSARVTDVPDFVAPPPVDSDTAGESDGEPREGVTYVSTETIQIPDNNPTGASLAVNVAESGLSGQVTVAVSITHTWRGDLVVTLMHGDTSVVLHNRQGGGTDNLELEVDLEDFANEDREGKWILTVQDTARADVGTIDHFSVTVY